MRKVNPKRPKIINIHLKFPNSLKAFKFDGCKKKRMLNKKLIVMAI
jgi:hypothetical protein